VHTGAQAVRVCGWGGDTCPARQREGDRGGREKRRRRESMGGGGGWREVVGRERQGAGIVRYRTGIEM